MYYYDDLSYKEIAEALDVSVNTVSTNIKAAKDMIREELDNRKKEAPSAADIAVPGIAVDSLMKEAITEDAKMLYPDSKLDRIANEVGRSIRETPTRGTDQVGKGNSAGKTGAAATLAAHPVKAYAAIALISMLVIMTIAVTFATGLINPPGINEANQSNKSAEQADSRESAEDTDDPTKEGPTDSITEAEDNTTTAAFHGEIIFTGGQCGCGHVNPQSIELTGITDQAGGAAETGTDNGAGTDTPTWTITSLSDNSVVYSGTGTRITGELTALYDAGRDGDYVITYRYTVLDIQRIFRIDTGYISDDQYE